MRLLQGIHAAVTALLLVAVLGFGVLVLAGLVQVRFVARSQPGERPAVDARAGPGDQPVGAKARLVVVRGAKTGMSYPLWCSGQCRLRDR
jgi:hypothetical protein